MNWGWKIAIGYTAFALFILYLVYRTTGVEFELVTPDYYAQELAYQGQIDKRKTALTSGLDLEVLIQDGQVLVQFSQSPGEIEATGDLLFFRPSDSGLDRKFQWEMDESGAMTIGRDAFERGQYVFKADCVFEGKSFFVEKPVFIP